MKPRWPIYLLLLVGAAGGSWLAIDRYLPKEPLEAQEEVQAYFDLIQKNGATFDNALAKIRRHWQPGYRYPLLEFGRKLPPAKRERVAKLLSQKTGQDFKYSWRKGQAWSWNQPYEPSPGLLRYKIRYYSYIDPKFAAHFQETETATIRLDEIQWGGVRRFGIPPLKNPAMLAPAEADYLEDSNVVFGVTINGESRCYPKRILAWHEMFKDVIGGMSVCGVY